MATLFTPQNAPRDLKSLQEMSNSTLYRLALQINLFKDNESNEQAFIALPITEKAEHVHRQLLFLDQNPQAASGMAMTMTLPSHQPQHTEQDHMNQPPFPGAPPAPPGFAPPQQQQLPYGAPPGAPPGYGAPPAPPGFAPPQQQFAPPPGQQFAPPPAPGGFAPPSPPGGFAPPQPPGFAPPPAPGGFAPPAAPPQAPGGFAPPPGAPSFAPPQAPPAPGGWAPPGAPGGFTPPPAPPGPTQPGAPMGAPPPAFAPPGAPQGFQPPGGFQPPAPAAPPPQRSPSTPTDPNNQGTAAGQLLEAIQALTSQMQRQNELLGGLLTLGENGFITSVLLAERMQIPRQQLSQLLASERDAIRHLTQGKA